MVCTQLMNENTPAESVIKKIIIIMIIIIIIIIIDFYCACFKVRCSHAHKCSKF